MTENLTWELNYLCMLQKIFILDKKGKEYSAFIDIDYYSKKNRKSKNI